MNFFENLSPQYENVFRAVSEAASQAEQPAYIVGGFVRDYYLQREKDKDKKDLDFVTIGSGITLAQKVADILNVDQVSTFKQFGTAHITYHNMDLEFVGARKESYRRNSRKPIVEEGTLEDDQLRRDLTINALSWSLNEGSFGELLDPFNGMEDLKNQIIRTPIDPERTFDDDPLRMMRAIRFATQLGFQIEEHTWNALCKMAERITIISKERITEELQKIIAAPKPSIGFSYLFEAGLLKEFFPEMHRLHGVKVINGIRHKDNLWHTLEVLDNVAEMSDNIWLRWAAILHDIAKPVTQKFVAGTGWTFHGHDAIGAKWVKSIFKRFGLPLDQRQRYVAKLVRLHLRPIALVSEEVTDSAIRRLIYDSGDDLEDLMMLCRADITSKNPGRVKKYNKNFDRVEKKINQVEKKDRIRNWTNPIRGEEIMEAFDIPPGKIIGDIKDDIKEAIFEGIIPNEHDAAYEYMINNKEKYFN